MWFIKAKEGFNFLSFALAFSSDRIVISGIGMELAFKAGETHVGKIFRTAKRTA